MTNKKVAIIGAGHNGLISACYLARVGFDVNIFERSDRIGGMCVTEELIQGFRLSSLANWSGMLRPKFIDELELKKFGLTFYPMKRMVYFFRDGDSMVFERGENPQLFFSGARTKHIEEWWRHNQMCAKAADILKPLLLRPDISRLDFEQKLRSNNLDELAELVNGGTLLEFSRRTLSLSKMIAAACAVTMNVPAFLTGTLFQKLFLSTAETNGLPGVWGLAKGGMGSITSALKCAAEELDVQINLQSSVSKIVIENGKAIGLELEKGERKYFDLILSNADLLTTLTKLVDPQHLSKDVTDELVKTQNDSLQMLPAKVHLSFSSAPKFKIALEESEMMKTGYVFLPDCEGLASWEEDYRKGQLSEYSTVDCIFASGTDSSMAPKNKHAASIGVYSCPKTHNGKPWDSQSKSLILEHVLSVLRRHSEDLESKIEDAIVISPTDITDKYGVQSAHCFHWPIDSTHIFENRPLVTAPGYELPIKNLFICGSSAWPGGTVSGLPGYNCAQVVKKIYGIF